MFPTKRHVGGQNVFTQQNLYKNVQINGGHKLAAYLLEQNQMKITLLTMKVEDIYVPLKTKKLSLTICRIYSKYETDGTISSR